MTVSNIYGQKTKYRITLELDVFDDFNPHEIAWDKVFKLEADEQVESYIENLSNPRVWGIERGGRLKCPYSEEASSTSFTKSFPL